ncbi:heparinase II/III domain-containing protein [Paenibacillus sp. FSL H8-0034]|uniref:heparinase II/III domain-containing protein n=1 Tax=Paenibacillus sp. FSL H8-0034 TaxID=2954671 RepID=UPI0030F9F3BD
MLYTFREIHHALMEKPDLTLGSPYGVPFDSHGLQARLQASHLTEWLTTIQLDAERFLVEPIQEITFTRFKQYEATGTRKEYEADYFERRGRLLSLVISEIYEQQGRYLSAIEDTIWAICNEYSWCLPAHMSFAAHVPMDQRVDLFAAETANALAETMHLLEPQLNPLVILRLRSEVEQRVLHPCFDLAVPFHWETSTNNWSAVCAGAAGMAALLLVQDNHRLSGIVDRVIRAMESFLEGYGEDGGCSEGVMYWHYGFGYYTYFADMLSALTNGNLNLFDIAKLNAIAAFPNHVRLSGNQYVNYSDSLDAFDLNPGLLTRLSERFGLKYAMTFQLPEFHSDHCYRWPHAMRNLLWSHPSAFSPTSEPTGHYLPQLGWVTQQVELAGLPAAFSAKGGHNGEPHNHNDLGHFIVHLNGESLLSDLGAGLYTKQYFGPERYSFLNNASRGHSVPIINGNQQCDGKQYATDVLDFTQQKSGFTYLLDITKAYEDSELTKFERQWTLMKHPDSIELVLQDTFEFKSPGEVTEVFVSRVKPRLSDGMVQWTGHSGYVSMKQNPLNWDINIEVETYLNHRGEPQIAYITYFRLKKAISKEVFKFQFWLHAVKPIKS